MNELALFAGAGGGILAGHLLGWRTVAAVEIEDYPRRVLLQRQADGLLPRFPIWDDICTFDGKPWAGKVDVISGGFPCQDLSAAGKGAGLEDMSDEIGKGRIIKIKTEEIVIEVIRYIIQNRLFVEQLATNSTYFKDPRLIDIFAYIKDHIGGDLSNKVLANVANVSEDYVGQYFKMLTGINPQDYIEYQRMEAAVGLLRTTKKSIRAIGSEVGYKDTAYFCRRFKMMFGIPAGKMRRRESLMNI